MATYYSSWKQLNGVNAYRVVVDLSVDTSKSNSTSVHFDYKLKIETANNYSFSGWTVGRYLKIGNTTAVNVPYSASSSETMTVGKNTTTTIVSDNIKVSISNSLSLPISAYIETSTSASYLPGKISLSGTYNITESTAAGGASVDNIIDNGDNTLTIVTTMGTDGLNNAVSNVHIYGFVNKTTGNPSYGPGNSDFWSGSGTVSGRIVTFRIPAPSTTSQYTVRVRAYSISSTGDNPGGDPLNSGTIYTYNFITLLSNSGNFTDGSSERTVSVIKGTTRHWSVGDHLPSKGNAEFKGYFTEPEGGIQVYDANGSAVGDGTYFKGSGSSATWQYGADVTLYAQWKGNQVKLKKNGQWVDCNAYVKYNGIFVPFNVNKNN